MGKENIKVEPCNVTWKRRQVTKITTIADVALALSGTWFKIWAAKDATKYYVLLDGGDTPTDPAPAGFTKITVSFTSDDSADEIATKVAAAIDAVGAAAIFDASASKNKVTVINKADGESTDAIDGTATTGFTFSTFAKGVDADLGLFEGDIELSLKQDNLAIKAHQTGTQEIDSINIGTNLEAIKLNLLETHVANMKRMLAGVGEAFTPAAGTEVVGLGTSKRFSMLSSLGGKLIFHPVRIEDVDDRSEDLCFWQATPQITGLNFSGEKAQMIGVEFKIGLDQTKDSRISLMMFGDWNQSGLDA